VYLHPAKTCAKVPLEVPSDDAGDAGDTSAPESCIGEIAASFLFNSQLLAIRGPEGPRDRGDGCQVFPGEVAEDQIHHFWWQIATSDMGDLHHACDMRGFTSMSNPQLGIVLKIAL
jgi:hypothetical protein